MSWEVPESPDRYLLSHCFTRMETKEAERLSMRDANQRVLSVTADEGAIGAAVSPGLRVDAGWVELMEDAVMEKLESCKDICCKMIVVWFGGAGCRRGYVCATRVVTTAENRPDCPDEVKIR